MLPDKVSKRKGVSSAEVAYKIAYAYCKTCCKSENRRIIYPNQLAKVHLWGVKLASLLWKTHHSNVNIQAHMWSL